MVGNNFPKLKVIIPTLCVGMQSEPLCGSPASPSFPRVAWERSAGRAASRIRNTPVVTRGAARR